MKKIFLSLCLMALSFSVFADTFNVLIKNESGWEQTALYGYGDGKNDILGAWPGMQASSEKDGYLVFALDVTVPPVNLIFNNKGAGQQTSDFVLTEAKEIRLVATATALKEEGAPDPVYANYIYVEDKTEWPALTMYAYADGRTTILGGWPGKAADQEVLKDGVTYKAFGIMADFAPANIILSNNGSTQLADFVISEQRDYYLVATTAGVAEQGSSLPNMNTYHIYVFNSTGWDAFFLYAWGSPNEPTGGWPGAEGSDFTFQVAEGSTPNMHLIFHNNVGEGQEGDKRLLFDITEARDYYLNVTAEAASETPTAIENTVVEGKTAKRIINGQLVIIREGKMFNALGAQL